MGMYNLYGLIWPSFAQNCWGECFISKAEVWGWHLSRSTTAWHDLRALWKCLQGYWSRCTKGETVRCVNRVNSFLASVNGMCFYTVWLDADACIICIMPSPGQGQKKSVYQTNCYRDSGTIWLVCRLKQIDLDTQMRIDTLFPGLSVFVAFIQNFILYFVICLEALAALEDLIHDLENNDSYNAQFNNAMHSFSFGKSWAWNSQKLKLKSLKVPFEQSFLLHQSAEIHDTKMLLPIVQDCCSWSRSLWLWCGWCWCWCRPRWRPF